MATAPPTHCFVCNGILNNRLRCADCSSVFCSEVCFVAHRKLMHTPIEAVGRGISRAIKGFSQSNESEGDSEGDKMAKGCLLVVLVGAAIVGAVSYFGGR